jgi:hypothetical protein
LPNHPAGQSRIRGTEDEEKNSGLPPSRRNAMLAGMLELKEK